jgi:uncharacterized membrane-anchored protein YitT (DUF2179 family)
MKIMNVKLDVTFYKDLCVLVCGVGIIAFSIQFFILPNSLASNGLAGLAVLINFVFSFPPSLTFFLINIPIFAVGWKILTRRELLLSIPGALSMSVWLFLFETLKVTGPELSHALIAGIGDGFLSGFGAGLIILSCGTSGGSVLLTRIIESGGKHSFDRIHFILDTIVLSLSLVSYLTFPKFLITLLSCFIFSKVARFIGRPDYREQIFSKFKRD